MFRLSGKLIVIIMFSLGILFASGMIIYWDYQTRPFRSLQQVVKSKYSDFQVSISGGKALKSPGKPEKLRIVFHDTRKNSKPMDLQEAADYVQKIAPDYLNFSQYDFLEIHRIYTGSNARESHESYTKPLKPAS